MAKSCELCNEVKDNLKNMFEKVQLDSETEIEMNAIYLIQIIFNISPAFIEKFYPEESGICIGCLNELITSYKCYSKVKNLQLKLNENKLKHLRRILPKPLDTSTNKDCNSISVKTSSEPLSEPKKCERLHNKNKNVLHFCEFCNTNFENKKFLDSHVNSDHIDKNYFCRSCKQNFDLKAKFMKHFIGNLCKKARNYCFSCNYKEFENKKELRKHLKTVHGAAIENYGKMNNMPINSNGVKIDLPSELHSDSKITLKGEDISPTQNAFESTESKSQLDSDELIMDIEFLDDFFLNQNENSSQFNDCWEALGLNFMDLENDLDLDDLSIFTSEPTTKSTELTYKCPRCQQDFTNQHNLFLHLAHTHHEYVLVCSVCSSKFNRVDEFVTHKAEHFKENLTDPNYTNISENDSKTNLQCSKCKKTFKKKLNFLIHLCKNNSNIMVQCNFCTDIFPNWKKMNEHQKLIHSKSFQCTLCDEKQFTTLAGLKYHLKSHDGLKEFECPYCKKKFLAATNLNSHVKTIHANFKFHICKLCDQRFATLGHLKKHVGSVHQKERSFICSICKKGFAQSSHLKQHMEIHTGQRKYPCNYCFKAFSRKIDLKRHEDKHYEMYDNEFKVVN